MKFNKSKAVRILCISAFVIAFLFIMIHRDKSKISSESENTTQATEDALTTESLDDSIYYDGAIVADDSSQQSTVEQNVVDNSVEFDTTRTIARILNIINDGASRNWVCFDTNFIELSNQVLFDDCEYAIKDINQDGLDELIIKSVSSNEIYNMYSELEAGSNVTCIYSFVGDKHYFMDGCFVKDFNDTCYTFSKFDPIFSPTDDILDVSDNVVTYEPIVVNKDYSLPVVDANMWSNDMTTTLLSSDTLDSSDHDITSLNNKSLLFYDDVGVVYIGDGMITRDNNNNVYKDGDFIAFVGVYPMDSEYAELHEAVVGSGEEFSNAGKGSWYQMISSDNKCKFIAFGSHIIIIAVNNPGDHNRFELY